MQAFDSSLFNGQSYFVNDGSPNYLILQQIYKTLTTFAVLPYTITELESKAPSNVKNKHSVKANSNFSL